MQVHLNKDEVDNEIILMALSWCVQNLILHH